jgi:hypothetical protein
MQDLRGDIIVVTQERQEQVLRADDVRFIELGFEVRDLQYLLRLFSERDVADRKRAARSPDGILDRFLQLVKVYSEITEDLDGDPFAFSYDPKQKVFGTNVIMTEPESFLAAESDHILNPVREISFHTIPRNASPGRVNRPVDPGSIRPPEINIAKWGRLVKTAVTALRTELNYMRVIALLSKSMAAW